ncbi:MAG: beta-eliminating lyase-related protein [Pseudomonadota bacterium]|nr:beta-eliminating lyase-related protein [Pseudomonadota bacterium]
MDRRQFLAAGGFAAGSFVSALPSLAAVPDAGPGAAIGNGPDLDLDLNPGLALFKRVDFTSDGLGLDPAEYTTLLQQTVAGGRLVADNYSRGGEIGRLEQTFADLLGKQAAMFVPTGTLANHLAVRTLAAERPRVLVQAESHLYNDSGDCAQTLSGLNLVPLAEGRSTIGLDEVKRWVERSAGGRVKTPVGVISIENPVRRRDHQMVDFDELQRVCAYAREHGIALHLDGARMFNLPLHSGRSLKEHAGLFDTVYVSLWKHFNGASGAILAGDQAFIDGLFHARRMFGGSLPHAWPQIGLVAQYVRTYEDDYARAWRAADRLIALLQADPRVQVDRLPGGTSRFMLTVRGIPPERLAARAWDGGIGLASGDPDTGALNMQVNPTLLRVPVEKVAATLLTALDS